MRRPYEITTQALSGLDELLLDPLHLLLEDQPELEQSPLSPPSASKSARKKISEYELSVLEARKRKKFADRRLLEYLA